MKAYNIGDCIRQLREEQNVNQEDLCHGLCNKSTLSRIERAAMCHRWERLLCCFSGWA